MGRLVRLPAERGPVLNAAMWLRQYLDIPVYESAESQFEEYFKCKIVREPPHEYVYSKMYVVFECEKNAEWFILRWS